MLDARYLQQNIAQHIREAGSSPRLLSKAAGGDAEIHEMLSLSSGIRALWDVGVPTAGKYR